MIGEDLARSSDGSLWCTLVNDATDTRRWPSYALMGQKTSLVMKAWMPPVSGPNWSMCGRHVYNRYRSCDENSCVFVYCRVPDDIGPDEIVRVPLCVLHLSDFVAVIAYFSDDGAYMALCCRPIRSTAAVLVYKCGTHELVGSVNVNVGHFDSEIRWQQGTHQLFVWFRLTTDLHILDADTGLLQIESYADILSDAAAAPTPVSISPDARYVVFRTNRSASRYGCCLLDRKQRQFAEDVFSDVRTDFSFYWAGRFLVILDRGVVHLWMAPCFVKCCIPPFRVAGPWIVSLGVAEGPVLSVEVAVAVRGDISRGRTISSHTLDWRGRVGWLETARAATVVAHGTSARVVQPVQWG